MVLLKVTYAARLLLLFHRLEQLVHQGDAFATSGRAVDQKLNLILFDLRTAASPTIEFPGAGSLG
jgi:hypothetical protein